jgi:hypothetical protein
MKTLTHILKAVKGIRLSNFRHIWNFFEKKNPIVKEADSLLKQINSKESEFLFI